MAAAPNAAPAPARCVDALTLPSYDLGANHPFARDRQQPLFDLLRSCGVLRAGDELPTAPATDAQLRTVHDADYLAALLATSAPAPPPAVVAAAQRFGLGTPDNPIAVGQHDGAAAIAGATLAAVHAVLAGTCRAVFQPAGGLHHAMPGHAAGFCLCNDLALGITAARAHGARRVLYVDFDVHHGDGVEWIFRRDPSVLTISFHETPEVRWPGTGFVDDLGEGDGHGYALNVPLQPGTDDASWLESVERVLVPAARAFQPDLIVSQHGCDGHRLDPLATLDLTTFAFQRSAEITRDLAETLCQGRWVATGGGGYQPVRVTPRAWTLVWAVLSGRLAELPAAVDAGFRARWQPRAGGPLAATWLDPESPSPRADAARAANRRTVDALVRLAPLLR